MSWDISIINFSKDYKSIADIPDDEPPNPLGAQNEVHKAVLEFFPKTDWSDPTWGIFDSKYGSIEFNLGRDDPSTSLMLHVRTSNELVPLIVELCNKNNWSALDCSSGEFLESSEHPEQGLENWRNYLAQILGDYASQYAALRQPDVALECAFQHQGPGRPMMIPALGEVW